MQRPSGLVMWSPVRQSFAGFINLFPAACSNGRFMRPQNSATATTATSELMKCWSTEMNVGCVCHVSCSYFLIKTANVTVQGQISQESVCFELILLV